MPTAAVDAVIALAALGCALMAGVFLAFSLFVMRGLAALRPEEGAAAMRAINAAALRPPFMALFFGAALACAGAAAIGLLQRALPGGPLAACGGLLYLAGALGVTAVRNVPMNERLAAAGQPGAAGSGPVWAWYLAGWTRWNHARALAAATAAALLLLSLAG
ncbi:MAG: anthrone oxygenase family protein [Anaeromyxobacter sp.]